MAKMQPGQCKTTKKGVQYCYVPGVGVRFQPGGVSGSLGQGPAGQKCVRYAYYKNGRQVSKNTSGAVRRCANFGGGASGGLSQPAGKSCVKYQCVPAKTGHSKGCPTGQVRRCARFA